MVSPMINPLSNLDVINRNTKTPFYPIYKLNNSIYKNELEYTFYRFIMLIKKYNKRHMRSKIYKTIMNEFYIDFIVKYDGEIEFKINENNGIIEKGIVKIEKLTNKFRDIHSNIIAHIDLFNEHDEFFDEMINKRNYLIINEIHL